MFYRNGGSFVGEETLKRACPGTPWLTECREELVFLLFVCYMLVCLLVVLCYVFLTEGKEELAKSTDPHNMKYEHKCMCTCWLCVSLDIRCLYVDADVAGDSDSEARSTRPAHMC